MAEIPIGASYSWCNAVDPVQNHRSVNKQIGDVRLLSSLTALTRDASE